MAEERSISESTLEVNTESYTQMANGQGTPSNISNSSMTDTILVANGDASQSRTFFNVEGTEEMDLGRVAIIR